MADSPVKPKSAIAAFMENKWVVSSLELITIILSIVSITSSVVSGSSSRPHVASYENRWVIFELTCHILDTYRALTTS